MSVAPRSVIFDTETTGLDPAEGHRVIEIACIELVRDLPSGITFHALIDPERDIPAEATRVHGMTIEHLRGKPRFVEIVDALLDFVADSPLIAHNAPFDFAFVNAELARLTRPAWAVERMICTLTMAKARYPGLPNSLDALCRRYGIDLSERTSHNALLDCRLLSDVYVELTGGRQKTFLSDERSRAAPVAAYRLECTRQPVLLDVDDEAAARHAAFLAKLKSPIWLAETRTA